MVTDYVGLIVCESRRADAWKRALVKAGIPARVDETIGEESENGSYKVSVPRRDLPRANELVTQVTRGERALPGSTSLVPAIIAIAIIVTLIIAYVQL